MTEKNAETEKKKHIVLCVFIFFAVFVVLSGLSVLIRFHVAKGDSVPESMHESAGLFYYSTLSEKNRELYASALDALEKKETETDLITRLYNESDLEAVLTALEADHPELFFVDFSSCTLQSDSAKSKLLLQYLTDPENIDQMQMHIEAVSAAASAFLDAGDSGFGKEKTLHDFLVDYCAFSDESSDFSDTVYGALVEKKADGEGYAKAMKLLLARNGIQSILVFGSVTSSDGVSVSHVWNLVNLGSSWYHLDASFDDGDFSFGENPVFHAYFNLSDEEMFLDHAVSSSFVYPAGSSDGDYYSLLHLRADSFSELKEKAEEQIRAALVSGSSYIELCPSFECDEESLRIMILGVVDDLRSEGHPLRDAVRIYYASRVRRAFTACLFLSE